MDPDTVEIICTSFMAQLDAALARAATCEG
jgi:hypothetical protein